MLLNDLKNELLVELNELEYEITDIMWAYVGVMSSDKPYIVLKQNPTLEEIHNFINQLEECNKEEYYYGVVMMSDGSWFERESSYSSTGDVVVYWCLNTVPTMPEQLM